MGPPLGGGGVDGCTGFEGTGDDPVQRERKGHGHDADQDQGQDGIGAGLLELAGVTLQGLLLFCGCSSCTHCYAPPQLFWLPALNWIADRMAMMMASTTPMRCHSRSGTA